MKQLTYLIAILLTFTSCESVEKKNKEFSLENHLKSNEWCAYIKKKQQCFTFSDSKMIIKENGIDKASFNVTFNKKSDSIVIVKVVGEQVFENHFRMKSLNTLYYSQGDENDMLQEFTRIE